jgi:hypothetical protein
MEMNDYISGTLESLLQEKYAKGKMFIPEAGHIEDRQLVYLDSQSNFLMHTIWKNGYKLYIIELEEDKDNSTFTVAVYLAGTTPENVFSRIFRAKDYSHKRAQACRSFQRFRDCRNLFVEIVIQSGSARFEGADPIMLSAEMYSGNSCDNPDSDYATGGILKEATYELHKMDGFSIEELDHMTILHVDADGRKSDYVLAAGSGNRIVFDFHEYSSRSSEFDYMTLVSENGFVCESSPDFEKHKPVVEAVRDALRQRLWIYEEFGDGVEKFEY